MDPVEIAECLTEMSYHRHAQGDEWSARSYEAVANKILAAPYIIEMEDICSIDGIGKSIGSMIESLRSGEIPKKLHKCREERPPTIFEMTKVPGIGPKTAAKLYKDKGILSFQGLVTAHDEGRITGSLAESIEFAKGRQTRIPRSEATAIIRKMAKHLLSAPVRAQMKEEGGGRVHFLPVGSYRRREKDMGDIDLLVGTDEEDTRYQVSKRFVAMGTKILLGERKASIFMRRTGRLLRSDLLIVDLDRWGAALLYFTGSTEHNIKLRRAAIEKGLTLNEFGLWKGRSLIEARSERGIYKALDVKAVAPWNR